MKRFLSALLAILLPLCLSACHNAEPTVPASTAPATTVFTGPIHYHTYRDADCTTPKTCIDCGHTRGEALGHDYAEGVCKRCGTRDATYMPLIGTAWNTIALNENGSQLELISLVFTESSCTISGVLYHRLSDVPMDQWDENMRNEENWYDYGGEVYYRKGKIGKQTLGYTVDGNAITCELISSDAVLGTLILERTAGHMLSTTYFEGAFQIQFLAVGDVFRGTTSKNN